MRDFNVDDRCGRFRRRDRRLPLHRNEGRRSGQSLTGLQADPFVQKIGVNLVALGNAGYRSAGWADSCMSWTMKVLV